VKKKKKKPQKSSNNTVNDSCTMEIDQPSKAGTGVEKMEVDASA